MDRTVSIRLPNGEVTVPRGTSLSELVKLQNVYGKVTAAYVDNQLRSLDWQLEQNCDVELLDLTTDDGMRVYRNSLVLFCAKLPRKYCPAVASILSTH